MPNATDHLANETPTPRRRGCLWRLASPLFWLLALVVWAAPHFLALVRWSWRRRAWLSACGALLFAVWLGWRWWSTRGYERAVGTYLTNGGRGYLVIEKGFLWSLKVTAGDLFRVDRTDDYQLRVDITARYRRGRLWIIQRRTQNSIGGIYHTRYGAYSVDSAGNAIVAALDPSVAHPGDWDLRDLTSQSWQRNENDWFCRYYWDELFSPLPEERRLAWYNLTGLSQASTFSADPANLPVPSLLHRVDEPAVAAYFERRYREWPKAEHLDMLKPLLAAHHGDLYLALHAVELEAAAGDCVRARRLLVEWQAAHPGPYDAVLAEVVTQVVRNVDQSEERARLAGAPHLEAISHGVADPTDKFLVSLLEGESWLRWIASFRASGRLLEDNVPLVELRKTRGEDGEVKHPSMTGLQALTRWAGVQALFRLLEGKDSEAIGVVADVHRLGQSFVTCNYWGGDSCRAETTSLFTVILNSCDTTESLSVLNGALRELVPAEPACDRLLWPKRMFSAPDSLRDWPVPTPSPESAEWSYEARLATVSAREAHFHLLAPATAGKLRWKRTGAWPAAATDLLEPPATALPDDPFAPGSPVRFMAEPNGFTLYSIGPDKHDDGGTITYDPSNGSFSAGDVVLRMRVERDYPIPRGGLRADAAADLLEQLPAGLPRDPSDPYYGSLLAILDATTTQPIRVFSPRPVRDTLPGLRPREVVPARQPEFPGWCSEPKGFVQRVFERPTSGTWVSRPAYDPTNGFESVGDVFLEIPKRDR